LCNCEALALLAANGMSYSLATGTALDPEVDSRFFYQVTKNLSPLFGEKRTERLTPE